MSVYSFNQNDPFDREATIQNVTPQKIESKAYMRLIREFTVPGGCLGIWFLGQNGFILKPDKGPLIGIDPYLTNSCAHTFADAFEFRLDRQLPIFIEPEDFDVDIILITHSHDDHADPETLQRYGFKETTCFISPWEGYRKIIQNGISEEKCILIHPNETIEIDGLKISGTFALPTDHTDLNHLGFLIKFQNGITFYNSGDTAYYDLFTSLNKFEVDIATICINGGFHNLNHMEAAKIVNDINPKVVIPCHYDMMVNNVGNPDMFRTALNQLGCSSRYKELSYYNTWIYKK